MTTITLTPTLTLSVADRRIQQSSIEAVWSTISQHIRATGRVTTVAVQDGHQVLRLWQLSPDGSREMLDIGPTTSADTAGFRLILSPWQMTVPYEDGPEVKEVSTLEVARAQVADAATAGGVDLVLQTSGTDEDSAETISPAGPEDISAVQDIDDEDDDLFEDLADEEDTGPSPAARRFRRRMIIGGSALSLFLVGSLGAAGWAFLHPPQQAQQPSQTAPQDPSPQPTEDAAPISSQAIAPAGFSGTPAWEVVGATDQSSGITSNGEHVGAVSGRALDVVRTQDGEVVDSVTLSAIPDSGPYPLGSADTGGLLLSTDEQIMTWSPDHGLVETEIGEDNRLVRRGTTAFTVPQNDDTRPDALQLVTTDGLHEYTSPDGSAAAPIAPARNGGFLWASNAEGGQIIHADDSGETRSTTRLIGPSKGTTISQWLGASEDYAAAIWSNDGSGSVLAIHDTETGEVVDTSDLSSSGVGSGLRVVPSVDGMQLLAGSTLLDLDNGHVLGTVDVGSSTSQSVAAVPGGWLTAPAAHSSTAQMLISPDGDTQETPESTETLLGLTEAGDIVVDNRGAIAKFAPESETEGDDQ